MDTKRYAENEAQMAPPAAGHIDWYTLFLGENVNNFNALDPL